MPKPVSSLFCFDFDNTLVDGHFHNALYDMGVTSGKASPEQIALLLNKYSILNEELLLKTFRTILSNGHHLAITTWSEYPEVIVPTLQKLRLTQAEIAQIHIEGGIPSSLELRKSTHIAKAKQHFGVNNNQHVFLIDDDEENILQARKEGQTGFHASSPKTNTDYLQNILNLIEKPTPRRSVRIASLNTIEGQRLFEVRNALHAEGKRRTGKRKDEEKPLTRFLAKNPKVAAIATPVETPVAAANMLPISIRANSAKQTAQDPHNPAEKNLKKALSLQITHTQNKTMRTALFISLSIAAALWFSSVSLFWVISASAFAFNAVLAISGLQYYKVKKCVGERKNDKNRWITENKAAYDLGCQSAKRWMPYLQSYFRPTGYTSPYLIGLNETAIMENKYLLDATDVKPKP